MKSPDYIFGLLQGEIIWLSKLGKYTEYKLEQYSFSKLEAEQYDNLCKRWSNKVLFLPNDTPEDHLATKDWEIYRDYAHQLIKKYCPETVQYRTLIPYNPENLEEYYKGIKNYLWNTDECMYAFTKEDIYIRPFTKESHYYDLTIQFKLNY